MNAKEKREKNMGKIKKKFFSEIKKKTKCKVKKRKMSKKTCHKSSYIASKTRKKTGR